MNSLLKATYATAPPEIVRNAETGSKTLTAACIAGAALSKASLYFMFIMSTFFVAF
jgi:hypothetical protein